MSNPYDWPKTTVGSKLSLLEQSLSCPICSEFFVNPHSLTCGHSFCSICIRKHLDKNFNSTHTSNECPSCKEKSYAHDLKPNRLLATITSHFSSCRDELLTIVSPSNNSSIVAPKERKPESSSKSIPSTDIITKSLPQRVFHHLPLKKVKQELTSLCSHSNGKTILD